MADTKISALTAASTPLAGTEVLPIVQSGATVKVAVSNLTAGRAVSASSLTASTGDITSTAGNFVVGTSGKGVDFSATPGTGTSELFADYEEGTFTPTVAGVTLTIAAGRYTKIGRTVFVEIFCRFPATADITSTEIAGLPFTPVTGGNTYLGGVNVQASISTHVRNVVVATGIEPRTSSNTAFTNVSFSSADVNLAGTYTA
jgi:hypothetical protein